MLDIDTTNNFPLRISLIKHIFLSIFHTKFSQACSHLQSIFSLKFKRKTIRTVKKPLNANFQLTIYDYQFVSELRHAEQREEIVECETGSVATESKHRWSWQSVGNDKRRQRNIASNDLRGSMALWYGSVFETWTRATRLHDTTASAATGSTSIGSMFLSGISQWNHPEIRQLPQVRWSPIGWCTFRRNMSATTGFLEVEAQPRR